MKYKKTVEQRRWVRELPMTWETRYIEDVGVNKLITTKPIKSIRWNQLRDYYRRNKDGMGLSVYKMRQDMIFDTLAGIALDALPKDII